MDKELLEKFIELQNNRIDGVDDCICHISLAIDALTTYKNTYLKLHLLSDDLQSLLTEAKVIARDLKEEARRYE